MLLLFERYWVEGLFSSRLRWMLAQLSMAENIINERMEDIPVTMIEASVRKQNQTPVLADSQHPLLLWHKVALGAVLAISAFFNFFALSLQDFFEPYYAAAIKSMLTNWHNFFFVSFDSGGFLAVDKPPLGMWMQVLSARLLGFSTFSVLFPQALAGVLAVGLLFQLVRRVFGPLAGLIAALVLALSPISIVTNRNNMVDSLLVLTVLLGAWAVSKAAETGRLRWLLLCAVLVGLGFNIKMLQAYLVVPAFGLLYLLGAPVRWRTKSVHLALAVAVLLVVSLSWVTIVDLTPASQRPYLYTSELDLAVGINGTYRLNAPPLVVSTWNWEIGMPGPLRFFEQPMGEQLSWLLPLALLGLLVLSWQQRWRLPLDRQQQALVLWASWLLTMVVFFSDAHFFHMYYLSILVPAVAALVGVGVVRLWQDHVRPGWHGWLLPAALLLTGAFQAYLLAPFPQWSKLLTPSIVGACATVALALLLRRWRFPLCWQPVAVTITALGFLSLLLAPTVWAAIPLSQNRAFPLAGPESGIEVSSQHADPALERYLLAHKGHVQFLLATMTATVAAPIILDTGQPVMTLGGYANYSSLLTREQLIQQVDAGTVRFFLLPTYALDDPSQLPSQLSPALRVQLEENGEVAPEAIGWVITHCRAVPPAQWQSGSTASFVATDTLQLYDCAHHT
jgi:4-amino-4-deoxy-L-arabinose transferase-like glycosyltransferase